MPEQRTSLYPGIFPDTNPGSPSPPGLVVACTLLVVGHFQAFRRANTPEERTYLSYPEILLGTDPLVVRVLRAHSIGVPVLGEVAVSGFQTGQHPRITHLPQLP